MGAGASAEAPSCDDIDMSKWSKEEVAEEVVGMGTAFEGYKEMVLDNNIDGKTLGILTSDDLESVGMAKCLHRKQILAKVDELSNNQAAMKRSKPAAAAAAVAAAVAARSAAQGNKIFLSYARGDESTPFARRLKAFMEEHGFEVWMDEEGIAGGADFMGAIGKNPQPPPPYCAMCSLRACFSNAICRYRNRGVPRPARGD